MRASLRKQIFFFGKWENYFGSWENYFGRWLNYLEGGEISLAGQVGKSFLQGLWENDFGWWENFFGTREFLNNGMWGFYSPGLVTTRRSLGRHGSSDKKWTSPPCWEKCLGKSIQKIQPRHCQPKAGMCLVMMMMRLSSSRWLKLSIWSTLIVEHDFDDNDDHAANMGPVPQL